MRILLVGLIILSSLAGCAEELQEAPVEVEPVDECAEGYCVQDPLITDDGRDMRKELIATDKVPAPEWQLGDVFEQHMFFGSEDESGNHIQTMVIAVDDQGYTLAAADPESSRNHAMYEYPILGQIGLELQTNAFGTNWDWMFKFPMADGMKWTGSVDQLINWNSYTFTDFDIELTATYDEAIDTPAGEFPGFIIEGMAGEDLLLRYNYVPAVGWFSHFWLYDIETIDPTDVMFHAMSMGTWSGYEGFYYTAVEDTLLEKFWGVFPNPAAPVTGDPMPVDIEFPDEHDALMGIAVPIAASGYTEVHLTAPDGIQQTCKYQQISPEGRSFNVCFYDLPAQDGTWNVRTVGAGAATGSFVWISAVDVTEFTMGPE